MHLATYVIASSTQPITFSYSSLLLMVFPSDKHVIHVAQYNAAQK